MFKSQTIILGACLLQAGSGGLSIIPAGRQVFLPEKGKKDVISPEVSGSNANSVRFKHFGRI